MTADRETPPTRATQLAGKTIDAHSHAGVDLRAYIHGEYPYAQTIEGLRRQQDIGGVDVTVVFPFSGDLFFAWEGLAQGKCVRTDHPVSATPYAAENHLLLAEIFRYAEVEAGRFIPFVCADSSRECEAQVDILAELLETFPIGGIKINPVGCQSPVRSLLDEGSVIMEFARKHDLPMIFHATTIPFDEYSQADDIFDIAQRWPEVRICFAHGMHFDKRALDRAAAMPNVWVDTAAMKIQVDLVRKCIDEKRLDRSNLISADYTSYLDVMGALCEEYGDMILWGTDSPAYTFIRTRLQGPNRKEEFAFAGTYEQEVQALQSLSMEMRQRISNRNTVSFLTGIRP